MPDKKGSFADWLDVKKCALVLREQHWPDGVVKCPFCHSKDVVILGKYQEIFLRYKCNNYSLKEGKTKTFNDKTGTMYENSKVSITKWFYAVSLIRNKVSDLELSKELQVDYNTARKISLMIKSNFFFLGR